MDNYILFLPNRADNYDREVFMARILENRQGRRNVLLTTDDIISVVREYQKITSGVKSYDEIREILEGNRFYLPEEII